MIQSQKQYMSATIDPLSLSGGIRIVSGAAVQTFNAGTKEYEPDRSLVPLILQAYLSAGDPEGVQGGSQELTGVTWYEGAPSPANAISAGADYEIGDGTVTGFPKYALKVKKNVAHTAPLQLHCRMKFTDKRRQEERSLEASINLYTTFYDDAAYTLRLDCPGAWVVNPLKETTWRHTLTAQLYKGKEAVADAHAAYWWEVKDDTGGWRSPDEKDLKVWIECKDSGGNFTKTLTFDARLFKTASFRVTAMYYEGPRPSVAGDSSVKGETTVRVSLPLTMRVDAVLTKGARMKYDFSTTAGYEANIYDNRKAVTDAQAGELFQTRWKGKSAKSGTSEVYLDAGREISFVPKDKGFDPKYPVAVYPEVSTYKKHVVLTDANGKWLTDGNGNALIAPTFE